MKRKMIFGVVVLALFVLQAQVVFAQNISFQLDVSNGNLVIANGQLITARVQYIEVQVKDSGMAIGIQFKDGSMQTYAWTDINEVDDGWGVTTWNNVRMVNPNTGGFFPERFTGRSKIFMDGSGFFQFHILDSQGILVLQAHCVMRNTRYY